MDKLEGIIKSTIFRNEENGYTVLVLKAGKRLHTVVGSFPPMGIGEQIIVTGEWKVHATYGQQFVASSLEILKPTTALGIKRFLESGFVKGIGKATARRIVETFGEDALHVLEQCPEELRRIKGLSAARVDQIARSYQSLMGTRQGLIFLQSLGIPAATAQKISQFYGEKTRDILTENPYQPCMDIEGFGFLSADPIALSLGFPKDAPQRLKSALAYTLLEAAQSNGHCYLPRETLLLECQRITGVDEEVISVQLQSQILSGELVLEEGEEEDRIYLPAYYAAECEICLRLSLLMESAPPARKTDVQKQITRFEQEHQMRFSEKQKEAIACALEFGVFIITGGPGTGKTTIINCIISLLSRKGNVLLCAPTGRAAKRMSETTGMEAKTIHRLLEYSGEEKSFTYDESKPLNASCIICDETSMVDLMLMRALLRAITPGTRLIMVGDADQLPSVGAGNVLRDLLSSQVIPAVRLTDIFRQSAESRIVTNAHRINHGEMPVFNEKGTDFFLERCHDPQLCAETVVGLVSTRLPSFLHYTAEERMRMIQVLSPHKKGTTGVLYLNTVLQSALNPPSPDKPSVEWNETVFRLGDKVMQTKNDYMLEWTRDGENGSGVFNGDIGYIVEVDTEDEIVQVRFEDDRLAAYTSEDAENLDLAYCMSVHKSQGSEFPVLVMPVCACPSLLQTRNLFYTALTRAQSLVMLVGEEGIIRNMVRNDRITRRFTTLSERLHASLTQTPGDSFPGLAKEV
ncbi:MAG: ATP-dependent RecD-like DNA helicase [Clostridia bacterium]|nr:ATP-dependent RecD-like DNA helicase [Clostridia bacterium]